MAGKKSLTGQISSAFNGVEIVPLAEAGAIIGAVGIGAYFVYKIINPSSGGGSCSDPSTPCGAAVAPGLNEASVCLQQLTQLNTTIATQGSGPTAGQTAAINTALTCIKNGQAAAAAAAAGFVAPNDVQTIIQDAALLTFAYVTYKYGLPNLTSFINDQIQNGKITTAITDFLSGASVINNASPELAVVQGLVTPGTGSAWVSSVQSTGPEAISTISSYQDTLVSIQAESQEEADANVSTLTQTITSDVETAATDLESDLYPPPLYPPSGCNSCQGKLNPTIAAARGR